ncbi:MAG TPA: DUF1646 family protein [Candidatus Binataceae bacterium]|nr:DUF1646 family protein [Candidatus Binataceae bacterium]
MTPLIGIVLLTLLVLGPVVSRLIEEHIEIFFLTIGATAMTFAGAWQWEVAGRAASVPLGITATVIVADIIFGRIRGQLDTAVGWMQARIEHRLLTGGTVLVIALLSAVLTAVVAALMLAELIELMGLGPRARVRVTVAGCFAIGLGSSLTPLGGPLSTLAASGLGIGFSGLFVMLAPFVLPGILVCAIAAGLIATDHESAIAFAAARTVVLIRESVLRALFRGIEIYAFIAGLVLVGEAFGPLAGHYVPLISRSMLYWANTLSAAMDNATLVALEMRSMDPVRAREAMMALLIAGGMLIPGNVPNIVAAAALRIGASDWAKIGIPAGLVLLTLYFIILRLVA